MKRDTITAAAFARLAHRCSDFVRQVLGVATGSTDGTAPAFPFFAGNPFEAMRGDVRPEALDSLVLAYAQVSSLTQWIGFHISQTKVAGYGVRYGLWNVFVILLRWFGAFYDCLV